MSIPKIAISNEDDSSLRILENRLRVNANPNISSAYKSIIKARPSQPQSPASSTTTQSFHTCFESTRKESFDRSSNRSYAVSIGKNNSDQNFLNKQSSLYKNPSVTTIQSDNHRKKHSEQQQQQYLLKPMRRINSYQPSTPTKRFDIREDKLMKEEKKNSYPIVKRRSTINHFTYPMIQIDTSSIYGTPKHEEDNQYLDNSIRLVVDTDTNMPITINDQSDMQVDVTKNKNQPQIGVSLPLVGNRYASWTFIIDHFLYL